MASDVRAEGLGQGRGEMFSGTMLAVFCKLIHLMTHFWVIWGTRAHFSLPQTPNESTSTFPPQGAVLT